MKPTLICPSPYALAVGVILAVSSVAQSAQALQPIESFLIEARARNFDRREALHLVQQRDMDLREARRKLLPVIGLHGAATFNQFETKAAFPRADGTRMEALITPQNQLDGYLSVDVPLIDPSSWSKIGVQASLHDAAVARLEATSLDIEKQIARAFYQVYAQRAVLAVAVPAHGIGRGGVLMENIET